MLDYKQVDEIIAQVKANTSFTKADIVVKIAVSCIGWPYVWGAVGGKLCTVSNRKSYMTSKNISSGDKNLIKKRCQVLRDTNPQPSCKGCDYYPNDVGTRIFDCQGFIKWIFSHVGISFTGGGCTSMWNAASNWTEKGTISTMPKDKICCIFRQEGTVMDHILLYDGNGSYIHCSGEVKKQATNTYKATHWAIPKGLYTVQQTETPPASSTTNGITLTYPTIRQGSTNKELVTQLQDLLAKAGSTLQIDGIFGNGTASAVRAFQKKYGLEVDGVVGPQTWAKLLEVAGNIKIGTPEKPKPEELVSVLIPDIPKSEAEALMKKYPQAIQTYG